MGLRGVNRLSSDIGTLNFYIGRGDARGRRRLRRDIVHEAVEEYRAQQEGLARACRRLNEQAQIPLAAGQHVDDVREDAPRRKAGQNWIPARRTQSLTTQQNTSRTLACA